MDPESGGFVRSQLIWIYSVFERVNLGSVRSNICLRPRFCCCLFIVYCCSIPLFFRGVLCLVLVLFSSTSC